MPGESREYLSLNEVASRWSVHVNTARRLLRGVPRLVLGRAVRYPMAEIERLEAERTFAGAAEPSERVRVQRRSREQRGQLVRLRQRYGL